MCLYQKHKFNIIIQKIILPSEHQKPLQFLRTKGSDDIALVLTIENQRTTFRIASSDYILVFFSKKLLHMKQQWGKNYRTHMRQSKCKREFEKGDFRFQKCSRLILYFSVPEWIHQCLGIYTQPHPNQCSASCFVMTVSDISKPKVLTK